MNAPRQAHDAHGSEATRGEEPGVPSHGRQRHVRDVGKWDLDEPLQLIDEIPKPPELAKRGGAWFQSQNVQLHLGVAIDAMHRLLIAEPLLFALQCTRGGVEEFVGRPHRR